MYRAQKAQPKPQKKKTAPIKVVKETKKEEGFFYFMVTLYFFWRRT